MTKTKIHAQDGITYEVTTKDEVNTKEGLGVNGLIVTIIEINGKKLKNLYPTYVPFCQSDLKFQNENMEKFTITDNHLKLLRNMYVPGNSSVFNDMAKILMDSDNTEEKVDLELELEDFFSNLHDETLTALQICLYTGKFEEGNYETEKYRNRWYKVD